MSEIYRGITLLATSTVDSIYTGFYIVFLYCSNDFCQLIELSYQIKIIFNVQRLSYINIRLTNVKFCSGVSR